MHEKYVQGCKSEFSSACMRIAPAAIREVSVMMEKGRVMSGMHRTSAEEKMHLRCSNASC